MNKDNYCVIMAGGVGSRFWPMSRESKPKQFLDILGIGKSLLQQTFDRFTSICPSDNIYIVTNAIYKDEIIKQLPAMNPDNILMEPMRRNTAPCIAYANHKILKKNANANIVVAPSDHLIQKEKEFIDVINKGLDFVKNDEVLLTLGIQPSRPDTGYGYIQINNEAKVDNIENLYEVKTFTEKPDHDLAKVFLESGEFYWNSGIFLWSVKSIVKAFEQNLQEVNHVFEEASKSFDTAEETAVINKVYSECRNISIDYGVMEKANNVFVLCSDFDWSDLGTWGSLYEHTEKDENKNSLTNSNSMIYDSSNCIVSSSKKDKLLVLQGLDDYIIVDTDEALLVCKKGEEQKIRHFVNDVKREKGDGYI